MVLVSVLYHTSATVNLNGTEIRCVLPNLHIEKSALVHVIGTDNDGRFILITYGVCIP